jgi:serine/threonine protein kinase
VNRTLPADARAGTTVGKYKLHEIVGRGGMGVVYRGEHVYIGKEVAVKILHEGYGGREESIKRFLREARAASLINHPNIVNVTDFGKSNDGTVFFVMELLSGEPLDALLHRERRLDLLRAITILNQLAGALAAAHSKGIVHRDLKPENVMLIGREGRRELVRQFSDDSGLHVVTEREKKFDFVKILDFGVAKVRDPDVAEGRVTQQGVVFGTPEYMAPETARVGTADPRTDVYALGVMFYEMLTGTVPFTGNTPVDVMLKLVSEPVTPPRKRSPGIEITDEAEQLIMKALAKDPRRRQQSMDELFHELQQCYGSVRYRRSLEPAENEGARHAPIPLQKVKRPGGDSGADFAVPGYPTPPATTPVRPDGAPGGAGGSAPAGPGAPILLTKRKDRKKTLLMGTRPPPPPPSLAPSRSVTPPAPPPRRISPQITAEIGGGPDGQEEEQEQEQMQDGWAADIEVDAQTGRITPARGNRSKGR